MFEMEERPKVAYHPVEALQGLLAVMKKCNEDNKVEERGKSVGWSTNLVQYIKDDDVFG